MSAANWFDPILAFANAKDLRGALLGFDSLLWQVGPVTFADEGSRVWHLYPPHEQCWRRIGDAVDEQVRLRDMLATLAKRGPTAPLWGKLSNLAGGELEGDVGFSPRRKGFYFVIGIHPESIARWYSFALAELISRGFGNSMRRCELDSCGAYFVAAKSRGPKRRYCSISHGSQARTKKFRERRK